MVVKESIKSSPRLGRVEYVYWNALIWFFLPVMLIVIFERVFGINIAEVTRFSGDVIGRKVKLDLTAFWFLQIPFAIIFTDGRVQDLGWPKVLAFLMWVPILNFLLFFWPGNKGDNKYGIQPPNPSLLQKIFVFTLPITVIVTLVFSIFMLQ